MFGTLSPLPMPKVPCYSRGGETKGQIIILIAWMLTAASNVLQRHRTN